MEFYLGENAFAGIPVYATSRNINLILAKVAQGKTTMVHSIVGDLLKNECSIVVHTSDFVDFEDLGIEKSELKGTLVNSTFHESLTTLKDTLVMRSENNTADFKPFVAVFDTFVEDTRIVVEWLKENHSQLAENNIHVFVTSDIRTLSLPDAQAEGIALIKDFDYNRLYIERQPVVSGSDYFNYKARFRDGRLGQDTVFEMQLPRPKQSAR